MHNQKYHFAEHGSAATLCGNSAATVPTIFVDEAHDDVPADEICKTCARLRTRKETPDDSQITEA